MKSILVILALLLISCGSSTEDKTDSYSLPEDFPIVKSLE